MECIIKEQLLSYGSVSEADLLSALLGKRIMEQLIKDGVNSINKLNIMTNDELLSYNNIGVTTVCKIRSICELIKIDIIKKSNDVIKITSPTDAFECCKDLALNNQEVFRVIFLDTKLQVIGKKDIFKGTVDSSIVHPREVFGEAAKRSASNIMIAHNHPSGNAEPSRQDIEITLRLKECSKFMGIDLIEHIIVGKSSYVSLKQKGIF